MLGQTSKKTGRALSTSQQKTLVLALLGLIVLAALAVRLYDLTNLTVGQVEMFVPGINFPAASGLTSRLTIRETIVAIIAVDKDPNPLGYYLMMLGWTRLFGTSVLAIRLPSVLFGVASVLLTFVLAKLEHNRKIALLAAGMVALNGYLIYWSQLAKMYSLGCFLGLAGTIALVQVLRDTRHQRWWQLLYVATMLAGLGTVVYFWFLFAGHIFFAIRKTLGKGATPGLLRLQSLILTLGVPVLGLAVLQGRRESYLSPNPLPELGQFLQFGFLFEPDSYAIPPREIPALAAIVLLLACLLLLILGVYWQRKEGEGEAMTIVGPSDLILALAGVISFLVALRFAKFAYDYIDPRQSRLVFGVAALALLVPIANLMARRFWTPLQRAGAGLYERLGLARFPNSPTLVLALFPAALIAVLTPFVPLFTARTVLLVTPYLFIVLAVGILGLARRRALAYILVPVLAVVFVGSVAYNHDALFERVVDYKSLADQWTPQIEKSDLILVQPHWATTPIFYYLQGADYHFVGKNYAQTLSQDQPARVWMFSTEGVPPSAEMTSAVSGYTAQEVLSARRSRAVLYVKDGLQEEGSLPAGQDAEAQVDAPSALSMTFSTYLGGSGEDSVRGIALDPQGNAYVTGGTASPNFPTTEGPAFNGGSGCGSLGSFGPMDVFITKFSPTGQMLWSRLLGGPCYDRAYAIQLDAQGYIYVAGRAGDHFPTTPGTVQPVFNGSKTNPSSKYGAQSGFVAKLSPDGSQVVWATYFGGQDQSFIRDMAVDRDGRIFLAVGDVTAPNPFITANAFQKKLGGGTDLVAAKLNPSGTRVRWATYFGGSGNDGIGPSVKINQYDEPYYFASTTSSNLPTTPGAYQRQFHGSFDGYLVKFKSDGSGLLFSTYFGGSGEDSTETHHLALDSQGNAFASFYTNSPNLPVSANAFQRKLGGGFDMGIVKFSASGAFLAATYYGGSAGESPQGIETTLSGNVVVFGSSASTNLPLSPNALQNHNNGSDDAVVAKFSPDLSRLLYATYWGGSGSDQARAGAVDPQGNIIAAGWTLSSNLPLKNAYQSNLRGNYDALLFRLAMRPGAASTNDLLSLLFNGR